ncbi:Peroxide stress-activated histidine kinase mak2 [Seminavis robusta]|uniref:Peroxide stress-activated histidine kinase mak2 n=1 Tax=Seminavis robusta TaxID=568900 RepID=A0A9N8HWD1_9STRA|nr:Peroxide stress-activated histidine kinase mak2 [Seminavis robusta]|eukprot:Sro2185_g318140.1 Peroxide stress-activated histidine kinase mak2 (904) ;mRNA; r:11805-14785
MLSNQTAKPNTTEQRKLKEKHPAKQRNLAETKHTSNKQTPPHHQLFSQSIRATATYIERPLKQQQQKLTVEENRVNYHKMIDLSKGEILRCLFDSIPAHIVVKDLEGQCILENEGGAVHSSSASQTEAVKSLDGDDESSRCTNTTTPSHESSSSSYFGSGAPVVFPLKDSKGTVIGSCEFTGSTTTTTNNNNKTMMMVEDRFDSDPSHLEEDVEIEDTTKYIPIFEDGLYHEMIQNIQTAIAVCEVVTDENDQPNDYTFCDINPAFEQFLGVSAADCVGKRLTEAFPGIEGDQADWIQLFGTVGITGETQKFTHFSEHLKNWYSGVCYQIDPKKRRFAVLFMEISQQMESQEALRESEERHRNLFESMIQGVVYQEVSGAIIAANPASERILGLTVDQMCGRTSVDPRWKSVREDGSDFPGNEHPSMQALKTGQKVTGVIMGVYHPESDENRWITVDAVPRFKPGEDKPYQVYATFTDVTERKQWADKLLRAKEQAEIADRLKSAFLGQMSHEIRTPLNGIMGHIDLALSNGLSEELRKENVEGLNIAKTSGALLLSIIEDILDLSKIEAGQMVVHKDESFSVKGTMGQTTSIAEAIIISKNKGIQFVCNVDDQIQDVILGDPFRLQQVINNLISNAIKFTNNGKVELNIKIINADTLEFSVLDTGKGIPATHVESIFEPFRQVDISDTRQHGGTGLGLTISRKLVNMMGGEMRLESSVLGPIRGSLFAFTLPYRPSQMKLKSPLPSLAMPASIISQSKESDKESKAKHDKCKILVAEDDPVSRKLVHRMLKRTGYDVTLACNGEEAVNAYNSIQALGDVYDIVLMDVQMPILDGHEATRRIREQEKRSGETPIPIIALSAGAMKGEKEQGLSFGMTDYLTKPVDFKRLVATLERHLGSKSSS